MVECGFEHHLLKQQQQKKHRSMSDPSEVMGGSDLRCLKPQSQKFQSSLVSWRLPLSSQCVHKIRPMRTFLSCEFKTQFETCQDQKSTQPDGDEEKKITQKRNKKKTGDEYEKSFTLLCLYQLETQFKWKTDSKAGKKSFYPQLLQHSNRIFSL